MEAVFLTHGQLLRQNGKTVLSQDLSGYSPLSPGSYRLCKTVTLTAESGLRISKLYQAEFAIVD